MRRNSRSSRPTSRTYWQRMTESPTGWRGSPSAHLLLGLALCSLSIVSILSGEAPGSRNNPNDVIRFADTPNAFLFAVTFFFVFGVVAIWRGNYLWHRNGK